MRNLLCLIAALLMATPLLAQGDGHFDWPLASENDAGDLVFGLDHYIMQNFYNTNGPFPGQAHAGADISQKTTCGGNHSDTDDAPVYAVADGTVFCTNENIYDARQSYPGKVILVEHELPDVAVLDMLPSREATQNTTAGADTEEIYELKRRYGYHHQLDRNTLQLNRGNRRFSEIGLLAGVAWRGGGSGRPRRRGRRPGRRRRRAARLRAPRAVPGHGPGRGPRGRTRWGCRRWRARWRRGWRRTGRRARSGR